MVAKYPREIDVIPDPSSNQTLAVGGHSYLHRLENSAIEAIQRTLGTDPGIDATVPKGAVGDGVVDDADALLSGDADPRTMLLESDKVYRVGRSITLTGNTISRGGILRPDNGVTITLNGSVDAGLYQWIDESLGGSVVLTNTDREYPEWRGQSGVRRSIVGRIGSPEGVALEDETGAEVLRVEGGRVEGSGPTLLVGGTPVTYGSLWEPPPQAAWDGSPGAFADATSWETTDYIQAWDEIVDAANLKTPGYVRREEVGLDSSGMFPIVRYVFEPPAAEGTLLLVCSAHAAETVGNLAYIRTFWHMVHEWQEYGHLSVLRHRFRLVVFPYLNAWGGSNILSRPRKNYNGVDLNRNYSTYWDQGDPDPESVIYRGTAPFSEPETQYVRDAISEFRDSLVGVVDQHDTGNSISGNIHYPFVYVPGNEMEVDRTPIRKLIEELQDENDVQYTVWNPQPSLGQYAASLGVMAVTPEYKQGSHSDVALDSESATAATRYYGNVLIRLTHCRKRIERIYEEPLARYFYSAASEPIPSDGSFPEIPRYSGLIEVGGAGIVVFSGAVTIGTALGGEEDITVRVKPLLGQVAGGEMSLVRPGNADCIHVLQRVGDRATVPFMYTVPSSDYWTMSQGKATVKCGIYVSADKPGARVYRYHAQAQYFPSVGTRRVEHYASTTTPGMERTYPAPNEG